MNIPIPHEYDPAGALVNDGSTIVGPSNSNVILDQLRNTGPFTTVDNAMPNPIKEIKSRLKKLETENKFLRLKILSIEGKFTQEEVTNIRKMLISEDESSRTLAESIIDNA